MVIIFLGKKTCNSKQKPHFLANPENIKTSENTLIKIFF